MKWLVYVIPHLQTHFSHVRRVSLQPIISVATECFFRLVACSTCSRGSMPETWTPLVTASAFPVPWRFTSTAGSSWTKPSTDTISPTTSERVRYLRSTKRRHLLIRLSFFAASLPYKSPTYRHSSRPLYLWSEMHAYISLLDLASNSENFIDNSFKLSTKSPKVHKLYCL